MGYYTKFDLYIPNQDLNVNKCMKTILNDLGFDPFSEPVKWYSYRSDMIKFSSKYPDVLFELYGVGEEEGDIWKEYYYNGKFQFAKAIITYDEFDESKLSYI